MSYHASGRPNLHTGSIIAPPPKVRASLPYGEGISGSSYGTTTGKHPSTGNAWTPALLRDVDSKYDKARIARTRAKVKRTAALRQDRAAAERKLAGTIAMGDLD